MNSRSIFSLRRLASVVGFCFLGAWLAAQPEVVPVSSRAVALHRPLLQRASDHWRLTGCLAPQRGMWLRPATHLDVVFLDARGDALATHAVALDLGVLRWRSKSPRPHVRYESLWPELPEGTARIEVQVHDHLGGCS